MSKIELDWKPGTVYLCADQKSRASISKKKKGDNMVGVAVSQETGEVFDLVWDKEGRALNLDGVEVGRKPIDDLTNISFDKMGMTYAIGVYGFDLTMIEPDRTSLPDKHPSFEVEWIKGTNKKERVMKRIVKVQEVEGEGLIGLMGERVTLYCQIYIYTGVLVGVNDEFVLLEDASVVYETGSYADKEWKDAQKLPNSWYVTKQSIESFGILK